MKKLSLNEFKTHSIKTKLNEIKGGEWADTTWKQGGQSGTDEHDRDSGCSFYSDGGIYCPDTGWF